MQFGEQERKRVLNISDVAENYSYVHKCLSYGKQ